MENKLFSFDASIKHISCFFENDTFVSFIFTNMAFRRGGNLSIEDGQGCIRSIFLEDGFLDFLNKVFDEYYCGNCMFYSYLNTSTCM